VSGPFQEEGSHNEGQRFDASQIVLDPYARAVIGRRKFGELGPVRQPPPCSA
jgi:hypothetical protein